MVSIFGRGRSETQAPDELVELDWGSHETSDGLSLRVVPIERFDDVDTVLDSLREKQNIVIMKLKSTLATDKTEVRRAIRRVQKTTYAIGGDLIGLSEELILVAPPSVRIDRSRMKTGPQPPAAEQFE